MRSPSYLRTLAGPLALAFASLALLLFAGCGGGGGGGDDDEEPTATVEAARATATPEASTETSVQIDQSFWHAGWKVTLGEARLEEGEVALQAVTIDAVFENLSDSTSTFNSQVALTSGGQSYAASTVEAPEVPGGLSGNGAFAIEVDEAFALDDATLTIGNPSNNQAIVPIGPNGDALVSLEPQEIAVSGTAAAGAVSITVERAELRGDLPDWSDEVKAGSLALTIYFSATPSSGIQVGQGVLQSENVALKLPDGTAVAVRSDGRSGVNELLQGKEGTTIRDLQVRFIVPAPAAGDYAFVLRGNYGPGGAMVEGELPFTIP